MIRENQRAAGHGTSIATGFAYHRGGFTRDGRLVHRGRAIEDFAVSRYDFPRGDRDDIAFLEERGIDIFKRTVFAATFRDELFAGSSQRARLRLAATFRDGFSEVREDDREEQPQRDLQHEGDRIVRREELLKGEKRTDERDEHHRVFELRARIELLERIGNRLSHDRTIKERNGFGGHGIDLIASEIRTRSHNSREVFCLVSG
jgi:hypothetical protein